MHDGFFFYDDRGADGCVVEKRLCHFFGDANTAVRGSVGRDVALMHRVTAAEEHSERHAGAVVMRAGRFGILARIDIRFHDVAEIVDVIAEDSRDVDGVLR